MPRGRAPRKRRQPHGRAEPGVRGHWGPPRWCRCPRRPCRPRGGGTTVRCRSARPGWRPLCPPDSLGRRHGHGLVEVGPPGDRKRRRTWGGAARGGGLAVAVPVADGDDVTRLTQRPAGDAGVDRRPVDHEGLAAAVAVDVGGGVVSPRGSRRRRPWAGGVGVAPRPADARGADQTCGAGGRPRRRQAAHQGEPAPASGCLVGGGRHPAVGGSPTGTWSRVRSSSAAARCGPSGTGRRVVEGGRIAVVPHGFVRVVTVAASAVRGPVGSVVERGRGPVEGVDRDVGEIVTSRSRYLDVGRRVPERGRRSAVLARLAGVRPDAVERVAAGRVTDAAGPGDAGRASSEGAPASGRAAAGTAVTTMSASAAAGGRRVGTGSAARWATVASARRAPAPPPRVGLRSPAGRGGAGEEVVDEAPPRRDIVGRTRPVGPRPAAQAWAPPVAQQDVRGVEPAVNDAEVVQVGERRGHRGRDTADVGDGARPPCERLPGIGGAQLAGGGQGAAARHSRRLEVANRTGARQPQDGGRRPGGRTRGAAGRRRQRRRRSSRRPGCRRRGRP